MKKTQKLAALLFAAAMMTLAGCEKENNSPSTQPQPQPQGISLAGTSWECNVSNEVYQQGVLMLFNVLYVMDLNDNENGEWFEDIEVEVPAYPQANASDNQTCPITYHLDGTSLTITYLWDNNDDEVYQDTLTYNATDTTFTLMLIDPQLQDFYGTDRWVFHLMRGSIDF